MSGLVNKDSDYKYHFYVFSNRDSDKVQEFVDYLVKTLEVIYDVEGKKVNGFNPERDMVPGRNIIKEHYRLLRECRFTFFVVDPSFMKKAWESYLSESSLKSLTDEGPHHENHIRFILITLEVTKEAVEKKFPQLNIKENIHFQGDYKKDERKWTRLKMALQNKIEFENVEQEELMDKDITGQLAHPDPETNQLDSYNKGGDSSLPSESLPTSHRNSPGPSPLREDSCFNGDSENEKGGQQPDTVMEGRQGAGGIPRSQISVTPVDSARDEDVVDSPKHAAKSSGVTSRATAQPQAMEQQLQNMRILNQEVLRNRNQTPAPSIETAADEGGFDTVDGAGSLTNPTPARETQNTSKGLFRQLSQDSGIEDQSFMSGINLQTHNVHPQGVEQPLDDNHFINYRPDAHQSLNAEQVKRNLEHDEAVIREKRQKIKNKGESPRVVPSPAVPMGDNVHDKDRLAIAANTRGEGCAPETSEHQTLKIEHKSTSGRSPTEHDEQQVDEGMLLDAANNQRQEELLETDGDTLNSVEEQVSVEKNDDERCPTLGTNLEEASIDFPSQAGCKPVGRVQPFTEGQSSGSEAGSNVQTPEHDNMNRNISEREGNRDTSSTTVLNRSPSGVTEMSRSPSDTEINRSQSDVTETNKPETETRTTVLPDILPSLSNNTPAQNQSETKTTDPVNRSIYESDQVSNVRPDTSANSSTPVESENEASVHLNVQENLTESLPLAECDVKSSEDQPESSSLCEQAADNKETTESRIAGLLSGFWSFFKDYNG